MSPFRSVDNKPDFPELEKTLIEQWNRKNIFRESINKRKDAPLFVFLEGPPTANGMPHPGHILTRVVKDAVCRYHTMLGYRVDRKAGWDTHGLPVEIEVEKELGLDSKKDIEEFGIGEFNKKCRESVFRYEKAWREITERIAFWIDLDDPYITLDPKYIESVWWSLRQIWDQKLLYKGYKITAYCPRCGTPLSSHEVALGYKSVKDPSIFVKFPIKGKTRFYFLVWTTTPWTLISNVSLAVGPGIEYVEVEYKGEHLILAKALMKKVFGSNLKIAGKWSGKELEGMEYEQLYPQLKTTKKAFYVTTAEFVSTEEGTGIVHIAPAFGEDDMALGRSYNLPILQPVDPRGRFTDDVDFVSGKFVKEADPLIIENLKARGLLLRSEKYQHDYPFCWRCDTPLLYYAREAWFIKMTELRDQLLSNNENVNWFPSHIKHGRFGNFLENVIDWSLSRERYWGTPLPIWECKGCGYRHLIGSIKELKNMAKSLPHQLELHRPEIDNVVLQCPKCNGEMRRVPEVIDTWYDSGSAPFAQWHYPFEQKEWFKKHFPVDFISEAIDQTRGWFYSLMAISTCVFGKAPYKNVLTLGHILDANGQKMSKSKGNVIDPWEFLNREGADTFRWYFLSRHAPGVSFRFIKDNVMDVYRRFTNTLWNSFAFFVTYANIDDYLPNEKHVDMAERSLLDQWLISRLNQLVDYVRKEMKRFNLHKATRSI
ncbi:MAG: isoleucine--tRNA ligase, partial [Candidatus Ranarchaeia archaeon]